MIDLTNSRFGRLVVLSRAGSHRPPNGHTRAVWLCCCDCGTTKTVLAEKLKSGNTRSCGCLSRELSAIRATEKNYSFKHGRSRSPIYNSWQSVKQRCLDPNAINYPSYGGTNPPVTICDRWLSFENFSADLGERPLGTTLGRKMDVGNYEPGNVAWQTSAEQVANRRRDRTRPWSRKNSIEQIAA
jgi:hypothetical protein